MHQHKSSGPWMVVYDDKCTFCRAQIDKIRKHDKCGVFEFLPNDAPDILSRFPQLADKDLKASLWLIAPDGTLYAGADAVYQIMVRLEKYKQLARLYRLPLMHTAARWAYKWIVSHRK
jgi:predicted DCC family thiol-disulfide oxidoreductase YuxK